jgi:hypothetical protein
MLHKHYAAFIKNLAADDMLCFLGALDEGRGQGSPGPKTNRDSSRNSGVLAGMGKTGVCWDNALAESFSATYKLDLIEPASWSKRPGMGRSACAPRFPLLDMSGG